VFGFGVVFPEQALGFLAKDDPHDFVYSYITRSGRISNQRLSRIAPSFMADYPRNRQASGAG
jgi:hypothetical protein